MRERLKLPQVTIFSADSAYVELTARALARSIEQCEFGDAILCSDQKVDGPFRHIPVNPIRSIQEYSNLLRTMLPQLIRTQFVLNIQWDGYVINPSRWTSAFLKQDYIGATWHGIFGPGRRVGNGGFSLRSRRLIDAMARLPLIEAKPMDQVICHIYRPRLESEFGVQFASERLADRFAFEFKPTDAFGFHGFQNMWRVLDDADLQEVARTVWRGKFNHVKSLRLISDAFLGERKALAKRLYSDLRDTTTYSKMIDLAANMGPGYESPATQGIIEALEEDVGSSGSAKSA